MEGRHEALGEHLELRRLDLDLAGRHLGVDRLGGPLEHLPLGADHPLGPQPLGRGQQISVQIPTEGDLGEAVPVAQEDEQDASLAPDGVHPAADGGVASDVARPQLTAGVGSVGGLHGS